MATWPHITVEHQHIDGFFFQINRPKDSDTAEFEVVMFKNGIKIDKAVFWDSQDSHNDAIKNMLDAQKKNEQKEEFL